MGRGAGGAELLYGSRGLGASPLQARREREAFLRDNGLFDVYLTGQFSSDEDRSFIYRALVETCGMSLDQARVALADAPVRVGEALEIDPALALADRLYDAGADTDIPRAPSQSALGEVWLLKVGPKTIQTVKEIRSLTGGGLKEARDQYRAVRDKGRPVKLADKVTFRTFRDSKSKFEQYEGAIQFGDEPVFLDVPPLFGEVWLTSYTEQPNTIVAMIKAVRSISGCGLKEAKHVRDDAVAGDLPVQISARVSKHDFDRYAPDFAAVGATIEFR